MAKVLHLKATVQPGGKVELTCPELDEGESVEVTVRTVLPPEKRRSIMEILNSGPERRLFKTAEEVKEYLAEEKASWDR